MIHNPDGGPKGIFHMFPDNDTPGERLFLDLKERLETPSTLNPTPYTLIRHQLPAGCKDFAEAYMRLVSLSNPKLLKS